MYVFDYDLQRSLQIFLKVQNRMQLSRTMGQGIHIYPLEECSMLLLLGMRLSDLTESIGVIRTKFSFPLVVGIAAYGRGWFLLILSSHCNLPLMGD